MYQSALNVLGDVKCSIEPIRHEAYQIIGPDNQIRVRIRAEPIIQNLAFQLREHLNQKLHVVVDGHVSIRSKRLKQNRLPVLRHHRLAEGRIDAVLNGLLEELSLR